MPDEMKNALAVSAFVFLCLRAAAAQAQLIDETCHYMVLRNLPIGADFEGAVVRPAMKERCLMNGDEAGATVRYLTSVQLTTKGLCKFRAYGKDRKSDEGTYQQVAENGSCPRQNAKGYAVVGDVTDDEFLEVNAFWERVREGQVRPSPSIADRYDRTAQRSVLRLIQYFSNRKMMKPLRLGEVFTGPDLISCKLTPDEKKMPSYRIDTDTMLHVDLLDRGAGLEVICLAQAVP